jgi:tetratricopeptide (TPR) repeat protein
LAFHCDRAQQWNKAFAYHRLAGLRDARAYANREAALHLRRALEIADSLGLSGYEPAEVHFGLGRVQVVLGEFQDALDHLTEAWGLLEALSEGYAVRLRARAGNEIGRVHVHIGGRENLERALAWRAKGLALLPETPTAEAALLHLLGATVGYRQADYDLVDRECERAVDLAQATEAVPELGLAHRLLGLSARARGRLDQAVAHCRRSIQICQERADLTGLARDYINQGMYAVELGDFALAQTAYLDALTIQEHIGDRFHVALTSCNLGDLCCLQGDLEQGIAYAEQGLAMFTALASYQGIIFAHAVLAMLAWRGGDLDRARAESLTARALIETHEAPEFEATVGRWLAQVYLSQQDLERAEAELQTLLSKADLGVEFEPVQRLQGQLLAAQGNAIEAERILRESLERLEQRGERYEVGRTCLALARVLAQGEGSLLEARAQSVRAVEIFADLGARLDLSEAQDLTARM